jgi:DNA-binding LacI/PurR family transcriptional regulator
MISLRQLAQRADVSLSTVSRALRDDPSVKADTREWVKAVAEKFNYKPNRLVEGVIHGKTRVIALINSSISTPQHADMVEAIIDETTRQDWGCVVYNTHNQKEREAECLNQAMGLRVSGIIISSVNYNAAESFYRELFKYETPFVLTSEYSPDLAVPHIHGEDFDKAVELVDHLHELGHRNVGLIAGARDSWTHSLRHKGFLTRATQLGLNLDNGRVTETDWSIESAYRETKKMIRNRPELTAIIGENDNLAVGIYRALQECGVRVPEDISVVGYGDSFIAPYLNPPLTTINQDLKGIGRKCTEVLFELIEQKGTAPLNRKYLNVSVPGKLVLRQSTGPAPAS